MAASPCIFYFLRCFNSNCIFFDGSEGSEMPIEYPVVFDVHDQKGFWIVADSHGG